MPANSVIGDSPRLGKTFVARRVAAELRDDASPAPQTAGGNSVRSESVS